MSSTSGKIFFEGVGKWEVGSGERGEGSGGEHPSFAMSKNTQAISPLR
jgi:hypothetical protein